MKHVMIKPGKLNGEITVPPSKSVCHRAVICAGLAEGVSNIHNVAFSQDVEATCGAMENFGVRLRRAGNSLEIKGTAQLKLKNTNIDCFESGSTLRFLIPIGAVSEKEVTFEGMGKLIERPLQPYYEIFDKQKVEYKNINGKLPLTIKGKLKPGKYKMKGNVSSQFISGLLFALPLLDGDSKIIVATELESKPYVDITVDILKKFSITVDNFDYKEFFIKGNQTYKPLEYVVEGDFSQAAFWLTAGILGEKVICEGLNIASLQGDKSILKIIESMGGKILIEDTGVAAMPSKTHGTIIDASQCPDIVPVLAVLAALSDGTTEIINAGRLRIKESDRLRAMSSELNKIGADIEEKEEGLIIRGKDMLKGGVVQSWNDHRIAMAMAVASIKCTGPLIIKDAECVKKSYPNFWADFRMLGGKIDEWSLGQ